MARNGGLVGRALELLEERAGYTVQPKELVESLYASDQERQALSKELDLLAYTALDYFSGEPQDLKAQERRRIVQRARVVWMQDPQAGAAVDLMNDFVFGRGAPKPKCHDPKVQEAVDEAWDDPDNQLALTSYLAQTALGTDLALQSNVFLLVFDQGDDGKVKLGLLEHDSVEQVVRDPDNRLRIFWYVARKREYKWDFQNDRPAPPALQYDQPGKPRYVYHEHWRNVEDATEEKRTIQQPPKEKLAEGRVYHIAINKTSEMGFGQPTMQRVIRWFTAYNDFMSARVDMAQAAAAYIMKRKIKGTPTQVAKMAAQALSRRSDLSAAAIGEGGDIMRAPRPGSVINENESVEHDAFNLNTNAGNAAQDGQMIRSQISAATRFPQSYYGDASNSNLATATSLELPVLKAVEARQEVFEQVFRFFIDLVIERAKEKGTVSEQLDPDEQAEKLDEKKKKARDEAQAIAPPAPPQFGAPPGGPMQQAFGQPDPSQDAAQQQDPFAADPYGPQPPPPPDPTEGVELDDDEKERSFDYEFSLPSPLRRMMVDLVNAVSTIAKTFDPNATNTELSRALLTIALGEGLEIEDPAAVVDDVFPQGYVDPILAAQLKAQQAGGNPIAGEDPNANPYAGDPNANPNASENGNPYGGPQASQPAEKAMQQARFADLPEPVRAATMRRLEGYGQSFADDVWRVAEEELAKLGQGDG